MRFLKTSRHQNPTNLAAPFVILNVDHWNDFGFITMFDVMVYDNFGTERCLSRQL